MWSFFNLIVTGIFFSDIRDWSLERICFLLSLSFSTISSIVISKSEYRNKYRKDKTIGYADIDKILVDNGYEKFFYLRKMKYKLFIHSKKTVNQYRYYLFDQYLRKILFTDSKEELKIHMNLIGCGKIMKYKIYENDMTSHMSAEITFESI